MIMWEDYSEIAKSAFVNKNAKLDHPVHLSPGIQLHAEVEIGRYSFLNAGVIVYPHVKVGRYCSIARSCEIGLAMHPSTWMSTHTFQYHKSYFPRMPEYAGLKRKAWRSHPETRIGNDVWIGAKSMIVSGVNIGDGAIIAAGAVVVKDVEPYSIVGGVPARHLKYRFETEIIDKLLDIKWWTREPQELSGLPFDDIESCIEMLK